MELILKPWVATCSETRELLSDELDGELSGRRARRVRRHLVLCPHCREALRSLRRAVDGLRRLGHVDAASATDTPSVADAVAGRLRHEGR